MAIACEKSNREGAGEREGREGKEGSVRRVE